jgi:hypothetical protein
MLSHLSQSTIEGHPFRPYEEQWNGRDWSISSYQDRWDATWSGTRYNDDLPSLTETVAFVTETVAGLLARVRAGFGRA